MSTQLLLEKKGLTVHPLYLCLRDTVSRSLRLCSHCKCCLDFFLIFFKSRYMWKHMMGRRRVKRMKKYIAIWALCGASVQGSVWMQSCSLEWWDRGENSVKQISSKVSQNQNDNGKVLTINSFFSFYCKHCITFWYMPVMYQIESHIGKCLKSDLKKKIRFQVICTVHTAI